MDSWQSGTNAAFDFAHGSNYTNIYSVNQLNQYLTAAGATITHDARGNLTSDGAKTYAYDADNRLTSVSGGASASLSYDPAGRLYQIAAFLAPRLARLIDRHPQLNIELVASPSVFSLSKREADLVVALSAPKGGRLYSRKLVEFELGLFATAAYLKSVPAIRTRDDLAHARFIGYISDLLYAPELDYIRDIHPDIGAAIESSNLVAQLRATLAGAGLCILPAFIARLHKELKPVLPGDIRLTRTLHLITHADMRALARIRAAADFLVEETAAARALFALEGAS